MNDSAGEYFEIYNNTTVDIDINGWTIRDDGSDSHVINNGGPLEILAGGYLTLGINGDTATNGGISHAYIYSGFNLSNGADEVIIVDPNVTIVDQVFYDGGPNYPDPTGLTMQLDLNSLSATDNDTGSNWCVSDTEFGTPGAANTACEILPPTCNASFGSSVAACDESTTGDSETVIAVWDFVNGSTNGVIGDGYSTTSNALGWLKNGSQDGVSDPHSVVQSGRNGFSVGFLPGIDLTSADLVDGKLHVSITFNKIDLTGTGAVQQLFLKGAGNANYGDNHRMVGLKLTHDATNSDIKVESLVTNNGIQYGGSKDQGGLGNSAVYTGQITLGTTMDFTNGTSSFWVGSPGENATNPYGLTMATNDVNQSTNWNTATVAMAPSAVLKLLQFQSKNGTGSVEVDQVKISTGSYENTVAQGDAEEFPTATTGDTYSVTLPYSDAGSSTFVVSSSAGTVGGDNPSSTANGDITVTGIPVGTDITITMDDTASGGICNLSTTITSPDCTPQTPDLEFKGIMDLNVNGAGFGGIDGRAVHLVATADIPSLNIY